VYVTYLYMSHTHQKNWPVCVLCLQPEISVVTHDSSDNNNKKNIHVLSTLRVNANGAAAELALTRKANKYAHLPGSYSFEPIAIEHICTEPFDQLGLQNQQSHR